MKDTADRIVRVQRAENCALRLTAPKAQRAPMTIARGILQASQIAAIVRKTASPMATEPHDSICSINSSVFRLVDAIVVEATLTRSSGCLAIGGLLGRSSA